MLTGPPEMGKTAIARMLGLALLTEGWEVHECTRPEQVEQRYDRARPQLFIADDAFGSTEYRPDAAERWASELERILRATDENHWLVWTSRPAPLRAGLRRLHRERGGERFPNPAAVQVDASALGVEEKTLILYRHARAAGLSPEQRELIRTHGTEIVEHPHFTPERIRRFVARPMPEGDVALAIEAELSRADRGDGRLLRRARARAPRAAGGDARRPARPGRRARPRRRAAPARDERAPEGAGRPRRPARRPLPAGDGMRVDWVHPSWRDLVIESLANDPVARRRFLQRCGVDGAALALSGSGGTEGERERPLLRGDADWDALGDGLYHRCAELDEAEAVRLLQVLADAGDGPEVRALAALVLTRLGWGGKVLSVDAIGAWSALAARLDPRPEPPAVAMTWLELEPARRAADARGDGAHGGLGAARRAAAASTTRSCWPGSASRTATATCCTTSRRTRRATSRSSSASCGSRRSHGSPSSILTLAGQAMNESLALSFEVLLPPTEALPPAIGFPVERVLRDLTASSAARRTLPEAVLGRSAAKSTIRGYLYGAVWPLTWSCSSRASVVRRRVAVAQDDDGADDRAALVVGRGDHRGLGDRLRGRRARTRPRTGRSGSRRR